ncbi:MAG: class I SAM-dependent methyltransferase [Syntrophomonadaceae bacterium]|nr:class I SAM-dependent methyltransferase [Syntrophomonadaceae bacterium]MDD3022512.1 class I SAM-dependent methyltransferase [Syntrophomonadaceae bacterium]
MNDINKNSLADQREWLEEFYREIYLQVGFGPRQNAYYMEEIIKHLDQRVIDFLNTFKTNILDMGCAMGFGTIKLAESFPLSKVFGLDVCKTAIDGGGAKFPGINFLFNFDGLIVNDYDVIISSHCLEHYLDPLDILLDMLERTHKYCIIMVPYNEIPLLNKHLATITEDTFPEKIILEQKEFKKISNLVFAGDRQFCRNDMIQMVYEQR